VDRFTFVIMTARFEQSLAFYRDLLEMSVIEEWVEFGHGAVLEAMPRTVVELIDAPDARSPPAKERTVFMGLEVSDVDAMHARIVTGGARVNGSPSTKPWGGRGFTAFDPDGMPVNIYTAYSDT